MAMGFSLTDKKTGKTLQFTDKRTDPPKNWVVPNPKNNGYKLAKNAQSKAVGMAKNMA